MGQWATPYNFTTNMLKAYLSAQTSASSAFAISKTHISGQKPHERQLNAKAWGSESAIFLFFFLSFFLSSFSFQFFQQWYLENGLSAYRHFSMKLMLITVQSSTTTQCLHSFKFILVNKSEGCHFLIWYTCPHVVLLPGQTPQSWEWD